MAFVDTMIGLSARAGFLDEHGQLPQIGRPMLVDAITTSLSPALSTTTAGAFVESATGIEAGGRTGFTRLRHRNLFPFDAPLSLRWWQQFPHRLMDPL
jgi:AGZA family xanthine/uracil permease-like MFS transporter